MQVPNLFQIYTERLNRRGMVYMVTGSVASMIYGEPRFTNDLDLVLRLNSRQAASLANTFPLEAFYVPPIETLEMELKRFIRGHFNLIHHETGFKADIYLEGRDPLHLWAMKRRRKVILSDHVLWVAPPEYVVIRKLEFYLEGCSEKHLHDIRNILLVTELDQAELENRLNEKALRVFDKLRG